jgi:hypothetical protein
MVMMKELKTMNTKTHNINYNGKKKGKRKIM